jgi:hypothetical protein
MRFIIATQADDHNRALPGVYEAAPPDFPFPIKIFTQPPMPFS